MIKYEYKMVEIADEEFESELTKLGKQGWRYRDIITKTVHTNPCNLVFVVLIEREVSNGKQKEKR